MPPPQDHPAAVLVSVQLPDVDDVQHAADLAELGRLVQTLGYRVIGTVSQRRSALAPAAVLGDGKLKEIGDLTGGPGVVPSAAPKRKDKARLRWEAQKAGDGAPPGPDDDKGDDDDEDEDDDDDDDQADGEAPEDGGADGTGKVQLVAVDHDISPSQIRNLERATGTQVLDRTGVIIEIFHRHARSREAKLQVEIARLTYVAPRLRETGGGGERQHGRGSGESALELDRRKIRDRIAELRHELASVQREQATRRALRRDQRRVALVGYTNAGKSSLMRALTGSEVLVADKLFATLDTTVRALHPEVRPRILVSDTVGFIKKLPHDLVASFRSTLDEALEASLLLYVADASDPTFRDQLAVTQGVLGEIGAADVPSRLILNKTDRLEAEARDDLRLEFPDAILMSAKAAADVAALRETILAFFEASLVDGELLLPYGKQNLLPEIHESARVLSEEYDEAGGHMKVRAHPEALERLRTLLSR